MSEVLKMVTLEDTEYIQKKLIKYSKDSTCRDKEKLVGNAPQRISIDMIG